MKAATRRSRTANEGGDLTGWPFRTARYGSRMRQEPFTCLYTRVLSATASPGRHGSATATAYRAIVLQVVRSRLARRWWDQLPVENSLSWSNSTRGRGQPGRCDADRLTILTPGHSLRTRPEASACFSARTTADPATDEARAFILREIWQGGIKNDWTAMRDVMCHPVTHRPPLTPSTLHEQSGGQLSSSGGPCSARIG